MKIAVLGPKGTYSDLAAKAYNPNLERIYFPTIGDSINAINDETIAIIPYENSLDGFVSNSMDLLYNPNIKIIDELYLKVQFSLVANCNNESEIKRIYAQFKAKGQCYNFLNNHKDASIIITESNMASLEEVNLGKWGDAAIIPIHSYDESFQFKIKNITDSCQNQTRFFVISNKNINYSHNNLDKLKGNIVVTSINDRPGMLYEILKSFYNSGLNLVSIVSRPTKSEIGKYHFYLEIEIDEKIDIFMKTINKMKENKDYNVMVLGIYNIKNHE